MSRTKAAPSYTIAEARDQFTQVVRQAERQKVVEVTRRGKPVAVMLSINEYQKLKRGPGGKSDSLFDAIRRMRESADFEPIDDIEEIFKPDPTPHDEKPNPWL